MSDGSAELRKLAADFGRIAGVAAQDVDAVFKKAAQNIKTEMQRDVSRSKHFHGMSGSISYDSESAPSRPRYVIGPDKERKGGALGNIYYFGTSRGGGSGDIDKPLRSEEPRLVSALEALAGKWAGRL